MKLALALLFISTTAAAAEPLWTVEIHAAPSGTQRTMFVLYDDGRVIWSTRKRADEKGSGYSTTQLDAPARDKLVASLPSHDAFAKIPEFTDVAPGTADGITYVICAFSGGKRCVMVHGSLDAKNPERKKAAPELAALYDQLLGYKSLDPKPWAPDTVEVHLYSGKPHGAPHPWPTKWNAPMLPQEDHWTTTIPGADLKELQSTVDEHRQFVLGVQRRDASYVVKLPGEERWRR